MTLRNSQLYYFYSVGVTKVRNRESSWEMGERICMLSDFGKQILIIRYWFSQSKCKLGWRSKLRIKVDSYKRQLLYKISFFQCPLLSIPLGWMLKGSWLAMEVVPRRWLVYGLSPLKVFFVFIYVGEGGYMVPQCSVVGQRPTQGIPFFSFPYAGSRDWT